MPFGAEIVQVVDYPQWGEFVDDQVADYLEAFQFPMQIVVVVAVDFKNTLRLQILFLQFILLVYEEVHVEPIHYHFSLSGNLHAFQ